MKHSCIIDRKELKNALTSLCRPVHHLLEVIEFTYAEVVLCSEREYWYSRTSTFPVPT